LKCVYLAFTNRLTNVTLLVRTFKGNRNIEMWKICGVVVLLSLIIACGGGRDEGKDLTPLGAAILTQKITTGSGHTCALLNNATIKCWGENFYGGLGLGDTVDRGDGPGEMGDNLPVVDLGTGRTVTAISSGTWHTCAILDDTTLKCWGSNIAGELGLGDTNHRGDEPGEMSDNLPVVDLGTGRTAIAISVGNGHTCALLDNATVKCWGFNQFGPLGLGDTNHRGNQPGEMGDNLPIVNLGTGRTATAISAGSGQNVCALLDDATVKCWGNNFNGGLGLGDTNHRGDGPGEMGDNLPVLNLGTGRTATAITMGGATACVLLDDATVKCWGQNTTGSLGLGDRDHRGDNPGEMGDHLPIIDLGAGRTATAVSSSGAHTCALLDNATVKCWGHNGNGQLGLGNTLPRGLGPGEMGDSLPSINLGAGRTALAVSASGLKTCALLNDGNVKCWGNNFDGGLGLGDTNNRGDDPSEMGDNLPTVDLATQ